MKQERIIWLTIFIIGFAVRSTELFHPIDTISWRESDISSIAKNYCSNGMVFSHPQVDWDGSGPGYTESEFPIYPYLIAISYRLFGIYEPTGRIITFFFSLFTMIIFFRLTKYLFSTNTAYAASAFFTLSPLLMITSNSIQSESIMFFFYICAVYAFISWMDNQSRKFYVYTFIFTALALLCKITAIHIGILFASIIIIKQSWRFLFKPKVILLSVLCVVPAILWYIYSHKFYLSYGNSLGISNEYAWAGTDIFTRGYYLIGIIRQELNHVWTLPGLIIIALALVTTKMIKKEAIILPVLWLLAVGVFYITTARTSADDWAFYYHIFTTPAASMLLGISVIEIYEKHFMAFKSRNNPEALKSGSVSGGIISLFMILFILLYVTNSIKYLFKTKPAIFQTSEYFACKSSLLKVIPDGSLILASGGVSKVDNYPVAFNSSYFFNWLDKKGYNICVEEQSLENVLLFKEKGAGFYIAETACMQAKQGFEEALRNKFKVAMECNGIVLFIL